MSGFSSVYKKFSGWRFSKGNRCADLKLRRELGIDVLGEDPGRFGVAWTARVSSRILTQLGALRTFARNTSETTAFSLPVTHHSDRCPSRVVAPRPKADNVMRRVTVDDVIASAHAIIFSSYHRLKQDEP